MYTHTNTAFRATLDWSFSNASASASASLGSTHGVMGDRGASTTSTPTSRSDEQQCSTPEDCSVRDVRCTFRHLGCSPSATTQAAVPAETATLNSAKKQLHTLPHANTPPHPSQSQTQMAEDVGKGHCHVSNSDTAVPSKKRRLRGTTPTNLDIDPSMSRDCNLMNVAEGKLLDDASLPSPTKLRRLVASCWRASRHLKSFQPHHNPLSTSFSTPDEERPNWEKITKLPPSSGSYWYEEKYNNDDRDETEIQLRRENYSKQPIKLCIDQDKKASFTKPSSLPVHSSIPRVSSLVEKNKQDGQKSFAGSSEAGPMVSGATPVIPARVVCRPPPAPSNQLSNESTSSLRPTCLKFCSKPRNIAAALPSPLKWWRSRQDSMSYSSDDAFQQCNLAGGTLAGTTTTTGDAHQKSSEDIVLTQVPQQVPVMLHNPATMDCEDDEEEEELLQMETLCTSFQDDDCLGLSTIPDQNKSRFVASVTPSPDSAEQEDTPMNSFDETDQKEFVSRPVVYQQKSPEESVAFRGSSTQEKKTKDLEILVCCPDRKEIVLSNETAYPIPFQSFRHTKPGTKTTVLSPNLCRSSGHEQPYQVSNKMGVPRVVQLFGSDMVSNVTEPNHDNSKAPIRNTFAKESLSEGLVDLQELIPDFCEPTGIHVPLPQWTYHTSMSPHGTSSKVPPKESKTTKASENQLLADWQPAPREYIWNGHAQAPPGALAPRPLPEKESLVSSGFCPGRTSPRRHHVARKAGEHSA